MQTPAFREALRQVADVARDRRVALMCAEAVPWRCHRQLVADQLVAWGRPVVHLVGSSPPQGHALRPEARVHDDGTVVYPAPRQGELFDGPRTD